MHETGLDECIDKVARALDWGKELKPSGAGDKLRGKGMALAWKAPAMPPNAGSSALLKMNADGTVNVSVGGQEIGQGTFTVMAQIAAETLGVAVRPRSRCRGRSIRATAPTSGRQSPAG